MPRQFLEWLSVAKRGKRFDGSPVAVILRALLGMNAGDAVMDGGLDRLSWSLEIDR